MILTAIEESGRYKGRFELFFEDGTRLVSTASVIAEYYLYAGKDISDEVLAALRTGFGREETRRKARGMIDRRAYSKREVYQKLLEKDEKPEAAAEAVDWLEELGLLDDAEYAAMVVRHYGAKGYGARRVTQELHRRGVDKELWDRALLEMPDQEDELSRFIRSKLGGGLPDRKERKRVSDALARRGYGWDEINSALRRYEEQVEEEGYE